MNPRYPYYSYLNSDIIRIRIPGYFVFSLRANGYWYKILAEYKAGGNLVWCSFHNYAVRHGSGMSNRS